MIETRSNIEKEYREFDKPRPYFAVHDPGIEELQSLEKDFDNLVVIGNGGSVTSFRALNYAFRDQHDKNVEIITTMEPGYLRHVERSIKKENTLVMPISKSGSTTGVIESTLYFLNRGYEVMPLTTDQDSALNKIAKRRDLEIIEHPDIGGRFTGLSETALAPASLLGLDVEEIFRGGREMHKELKPGTPNKASKLAEELFEVEKQGYDEVLTPFYSTRLFGFYPLLVQLMHESVCKNGEGQTFFGDLGPEYQHHTNQRMFGGKKNIVPIFIESTHEHAEIEVPEDIQDIELRTHQLGEFGGKTYEASLKAESEGVKQALDEKGRPRIELKLEELSYRSTGRFMAFLQYLAVYSSWLRDVDPFNQPNVEKSKNIGFKMRFEE
jgi:glucose-6-phosphate isomerase